MAFQLCEFQQFDDNGEPLSGGKVNVYEAGATTAKDSFPTADDADAGTNANANPVVLDSAGRGQVWGKSGEAYKLVITDSADVTLETIDDITAPTNNPLKVYTAGGTADALTITLDPNPGAWSTGVSFYFRPVSANTGSATININGIGAKTLKLPDAATNLPAGYLQTSNVYGVWYDGTNAVVVSGPQPRHYSGFVSFDVSSNDLPSGWSVAKGATGSYTITHNLALVDVVDMHIIGFAFSAAAKYANLAARDANTFRIMTYDSAGAASDSNLYFMANIPARNQ